MKKNYNTMIQFIKTILFIFILLLSLTYISNVLQKKDGDSKMHSFFMQKQEFDVWFLGSSHVIEGVFPMDLWHDYGIVSYNLGGHGNRIPTSYWVLRNSLDYKTPKLVVIDILGIQNNEKVNPNLDLVHYSLDGYPLSFTKYKTVKDLFDDPTLKNDEDKNYYKYRWEFFWDFGKYHERWNDLTALDFTPSSPNISKGASVSSKIASPAKYPTISKDKQMNEETIGKKYLKMMIEECQNRGIDVLLINIPYPANQDNQLAANSVFSLSEQYHIPYINFIAMDNIINYYTDCSDADSHLNASGGKKVTSYLGNYIISHYDIPDRRNDWKYKYWESDYIEYYKQQIELLKSQDTLYNYLMLLYDKKYKTEIIISDTSLISKDFLLQNLLKNLKQYSQNDNLFKIQRNSTVQTKENSTFKIIVTNIETNEIIDISSWQISTEKSYIKLN